MPHYFCNKQLLNRRDLSFSAWCMLPSGFLRPPESRVLLRRNCLLFTAYCLLLAHSPHPLDLGSLVLFVDSTPFGSSSGMCRLSLFWLACRRAHKFGESIPGVLPVLLLGSEASGIDYEDTPFAYPLSCDPNESLFHVLRERSRALHMEAELDCRGNLVHILSSRAGCTDKCLLDFLFVYGNRGRDSDHYATTR